ncbi:MAG: xanthine dehydrogenase family protein subunit M [Acidimicrobiia bacterium]|nr:xanthine dehydrogenase family protein subunit M [Acidimicrobiia bacterium]
MKPAKFTYHRAEDVEQAISLLTDLGADAKILAGGQSLMPMMNFRLARPTALVDISGIPGLSHITRQTGGMDLGALATHWQLEHFSSFPGALAVVAETAQWIGHPAIRRRGTIGGSLAHSDPVAEWCVLMTALNAVVVVGGPGGIREEPVEAFLRGYFSTSLEANEIVLRVRIPRIPDHAGFDEYARRHGDFAIVMVAVAFDIVDGRVEGPRVVLGGVGGRPERARGAEQALAGQRPTKDLFEAAAGIAAAETDPASDTLGSAEYRRHLVRTLVDRSCVTALDRTNTRREGKS